MSKASALGAMLLWARSLAFEAWLCVSLAVLCLLFSPLAAASRAAALWSARMFSRQLLGALRLLCGIVVEVRGAPPVGPAIIAAKHQSILDVLILLLIVPRPEFVMKRSLIWMPLVGLYALRIGAVPIDRRGGERALTSMTRKLSAPAGGRGQVVIYPQGSRIAPGASAPYRRGVAHLRDALNLPVTPVATNVGVFWGRRALLKRPGRAVLEFLPPLPRDLTGSALTQALETRIEAASDALLAEAKTAARRSSNRGAP